jgi:hypothetical protein
VKPTLHARYREPAHSWRSPKRFCSDGAAVRDHQQKPRAAPARHLKSANYPIGKLSTVAVAMIAVVVAIPVVVVFDPAARAVPVTRNIVLPVVTRRHPSCPLIRRPAPICLVPPVMASHWIPIAVHKHVTWTRTYRSNPNDPRRRRRSDPDSDRKLRE